MDPKEAPGTGSLRGFFFLLSSMNPLRSGSTGAVSEADKAFS